MTHHAYEGERLNLFNKYKKRIIKNFKNESENSSSQIVKKFERFFNIIPKSQLMLIK